MGARLYASGARHPSDVQQLQAAGWARGSMGAARGVQVAPRSSRLQSARGSTRSARGVQGASSSCRLRDGCAALREWCAVQGGVEQL